MVLQINDGTSSAKYALCDTSCSSQKHTDIHPLFYYEQCKETTCLNSVSIPEIRLNKVFTINTTELIIKGVCDVCNKVV